MKIAVLLLVGLAEVSCTTLANRRDLYSPQPGPDARPLTITRQTTTTTTTTTNPGMPVEETAPPPR